MGLTPNRRCRLTLAEMRTMKPDKMTKYEWDAVGSLATAVIGLKPGDGCSPLSADSHLLAFRQRSRQPRESPRRHWQQLEQTGYQLQQQSSRQRFAVARDANLLSTGRNCVVDLTPKGQTFPHRVSAASMTTENSGHNHQHYQNLQRHLQYLYLNKFSRYYQQPQVQRNKLISCSNTAAASDDADDDDDDVYVANGSVGLEDSLELPATEHRQQLVAGPRTLDHLRQQQADVAVQLVKQRLLIQTRQGRRSVKEWLPLSICSVYNTTPTDMFSTTAPPIAKSGEDDVENGGDTIVNSRSAPCLSEADSRDISVNGECIEAVSETSTKNDDVTDSVDIVPTADSDVITVPRERMRRLFFRPAVNQNNAKQSEAVTDEIVFDLMTRQMLVSSERSRLLQSSSSSTSTTRSNGSCNRHQQPTSVDQQRCLRTHATQLPGSSESLTSSAGTAMTLSEVGMTTTGVRCQACFPVSSSNFGEIEQVSMPPNDAVGTSGSVEQLQTDELPESRDSHQALPADNTIQHRRVGSEISCTGQAFASITKCTSVADKDVSNAPCQTVRRRTDNDTNGLCDAMLPTVDEICRCNHVDLSKSWHPQEALVHLSPGSVLHESTYRNKQRSTVPTRCTSKQGTSNSLASSREPVSVPAGTSGFNGKLSIRTTPGATIISGRQSTVLGMGSLGQQYVDPMIDATADFQQRINELTMLELDTIRCERNPSLTLRKMRKKHQSVAYSTAKIDIL